MITSKQKQLLAQENFACLAHKAAVLVHVEAIYDLANPKLLWRKTKNNHA